eukprot:g44139.t1
MKSVINFLRGYGFDGTCQRHKKEMVAAFKAEGKSTGRPRLLLFAAVPAGLAIIDSSYEVPVLGETLDFFNVMTYDFTGSGSSKTGENSPLYPLPNSNSYANVHFNVNYAMKIWVDKGTPAEKLNVEFATYGHTFILSSSQTGIGAPAGGPAPAEKYTKQSGVLSYYEICTFLKGRTTKWDAPQLVPYGFKGNIWVGYDNVQSFKDKVEWLKKNNYGEAMVWTFGMDDFSGSFCDQWPYPLINAPHTGLGISANCVPSKTTLRPAVPPTQAPSGGGSNDSGGSSGSGFCAGKANGVYTDPKARSKFYQCVNGVTYLKNCATGLVFDPS